MPDFCADWQVLATDFETVIDRQAIPAAEVTVVTFALKAAHQPGCLAAEERLANLS